MTSLKRDIVKSTRGFSDFFLVDVKLLLGKVLKISRRYLRPFLSYRENPAVSAESAPPPLLSGTRVIALILVPNDTSINILIVIETIISYDHPAPCIVCFCIFYPHSKTFELMSRRFTEVFLEKRQKYSKSLLPPNTIVKRQKYKIWSAG